MKNKLNAFCKRAVSVFLSLMIVISTVSVCVTNFIAFATTSSITYAVNNNTPSNSLVIGVESAVKSVQFQYKGKSDTQAGPVKIPIVRNFCNR